MINDALTLSLIITAVYEIFQQGMLLGWLRIAVANMLDELFGLKYSRYIQKPLWDCLPCMASIWTILLTASINVELILVVCGINVIIDKLYLNEEVPGR
ncbi:hypothetical protein JMG10_07640 [Nostoc ellipsosporum NOK]|nr:hypothetical protein [Nostoc ellipsosporum NOK]